MANNFYNAVRRNVSADSTLPTEVYKVPDTKKAILIELDVSNKSSAGITVTVQLEDEMSFFLNNNIASLVSVQTTKIHPTTGTEVSFQNVAGTTNYQVKFASPGDLNIDYGSTQGFAAAMSVALG